MMSNTKILHTLKVAASALVLCALAACSTVDRGRAPALQANAEWTVLPFANHTETPMAGNRAESVAEALLHARGVGKVKRYTELMAETLGVTPGSVTLFALANDPLHRVRLVLDLALAEAQRISFHPMENTATTTVDQAGLRTFLGHLRRDPLVVDFPRLALHPLPAR